MTPFRILSLDGGGIMGAFAASCVATFERVTGRERRRAPRPTSTGTSTGGIIAVGPGDGERRRRRRRSRGSTRRKGPRIFPEEGRDSGSGSGGSADAFRPRFSTRTLCAAICEESPGDRPLEEAKTRLVIPTRNDVNTGKVYSGRRRRTTLWLPQPHARPAGGGRGAGDLGGADATSRRTPSPAGARSSTAACGRTARRWWDVVEAAGFPGPDAESRSGC